MSFSSIYYPRKCLPVTRRRGRVGGARDVQREGYGTVIVVVVVVGVIVIVVVVDVGGGGGGGSGRGEGDGVVVS